MTVLFLTMELIEGRSLALAIPKGGLPSRRSADDRHPARRRHRGGARQGHHASRSEAGQHHDRCGRSRRPRQGARLRSREAGRVIAAIRASDATTTHRSKAACSARSPTCRPSRPRARRSTRGPISSRSASSSTRWRRASGRSRATRASRVLSSILKDTPPLGHRRSMARCHGAGSHHQALPGEGSGAALPDRGGPAQRAGGVETGARFGRRWPRTASMSPARAGPVRIAAMRMPGRSRILCSAWLAVAAYRWLAPHCGCRSIGSRRRTHVHATDDATRSRRIPELVARRQMDRVRRQPGRQRGHLPAERRRTQRDQPHQRFAGRRHAAGVLAGRRKHRLPVGTRRAAEFS